MKRGSTNGVFDLKLGLILKSGFDEIDGGDRGGNHEKSLSGMCEGGIDDGMNLLQKADGDLRGALCHLHALQPDLAKVIST